jgi:hypothetical protein
VTACPRSTRVLAGVLLAIVGCREPADERPPAPVQAVAVAPEPPKPAPTRPISPVDPRPAVPPMAFAIDKLAIPRETATVETTLDNVREVMRTTAPELAIRQFTASYVRRDGTLLPGSGRIDIAFALPDGGDGLVDDPSRPTGAPIPEPTQAEKQRDRCPLIQLQKGAWSVHDRPCNKLKLVGTKCSVAAIWSKAIADGAPADAVAVVERNQQTNNWSFKVTDKLRGVAFSHYYPDVCEPPPATAPKPNPFADPRDRL